MHPLRLPAGVPGTGPATATASDQPAGRDWLGAPSAGSKRDR
jgi:hypothetical protein